MAILKKKTENGKQNALKVIKTKEKKEKVKRPNNNKMVNTENNKPKKKKRIGKIINVILGLMMFLCIIAMCAIMAFSAYIVLTAPPFEADKLYSKEATILLDKNGNEFARIGQEKRELKTYEELPEVLVDAIVATEDSRFFQHNGFDVVRFIKASLGQLVGQDGAGGASTLTMQIAKNTFSKKEDGTIDAGMSTTGITRKFHDIYMAIFLIEKNYTKEEIIEFYVNSEFLGQQTFGVEQASQTYFGKSVSDLTLAEAALIAGIFNAPSSYNPFYSIKLAEQRRDTVLNLMVRHEYITEEQADDARAIKVESLIIEPKVSTNKYQHFINIVCDEIEQRFSELYGGKPSDYNPYVVPMIIHTTMDPNIQDVMIKLNNQELGYKFKQNKWMDKDYIQVGIAVTDVKNGSILAVNNGRDLESKTYSNQRAGSLATRSDKQPGSTAKPIFAYGPYIEYNNGNTGTLFYDEKMTFSSGQVISNSDGSYKGAMTMRQALAQSRNVPAVQAFMAVDKTKIGQFVNACGIDYYQYYNDGSVRDTNLYESYAIGGGLDVSPLMMAAAYGTFARGGYYIEPYSFTKVEFRESDEVYEHKYERVQAMSAETAYMITDMLMTATAGGTGGTITVKNTDVASKSGTSTYDRSTINKHNIPVSASDDNWGISYSPDYVISLWYGVETVSHTSYTDTWDAAAERRKISGVLANNIFKANSKFTKPSGVISAKYEIETNPAQLPSANTPASLISTELFKKGTEPSEISPRFSNLVNPTGAGYNISNSQVTLSWNEIPTPDAISNAYLQEFFKKNYGQFASKYLEKRIKYNNENIGNVGYQVYLNTENGQQILGYTSNPYYVYSVQGPGVYTFTVKSAYSIFKSNASSGVEITVKVENSDIVAPPIVPTPDPENPDIEEPGNNEQTT